jgi:hypothetical protein
VLKAAGIALAGSVAAHGARTRCSSWSLVDGIPGRMAFLSSGSGVLRLGAAPIRTELKSWIFGTPCVVGCAVG